MLETKTGTINRAQLIKALGGDRQTAREIENLTNDVAVTIPANTQTVLDIANDALGRTDAIGLRVFGRAPSPMPDNPAAGQAILAARAFLPRTYSLPLGPTDAQAMLASRVFGANPYGPVGLHVGQPDPHPQYALKTSVMAYDMLSTLSSAEIAVTGASALTAGRMHVCSGTSANYAVTLPSAAGNAGKFVGLRMAPGLTRWVTLTAAGADLIDGAATRPMWANESATVYCDGSSWIKVAGKTIPLYVAMRRNVAQTVVPTTWTQIVMDTAVIDNTSGLAVPCADTTNGRFAVPRTSRYQVQGFVSYNGMAAAGLVSVSAGSATPQDNPNAFTMAPQSSTANVYVSAAASLSGTAGSYLCASTLHFDGVNRNTATGATVYPSLSVNELPTW